jgi:hypothetical protein
MIIIGSYVKGVDCYNRSDNCWMSVYPVLQGALLEAATA